MRHALTCLLLCASATQAAEYSAGIGYTVKGYDIDETLEYFPRGFGVTLEARQWQERYSASLSYHKLATRFRPDAIYQSDIHLLQTTADIYLTSLRHNRLSVQLAGEYEYEQISTEPLTVNRETTIAASVLVHTPISERVTSKASIGYQNSTIGSYDNDWVIEASWTINLVENLSVQPEVKTSLDFDHFSLSALLKYGF